ncbi:hypothetical protein Tsubulata_016174 [Turnera subulata]|uniref:GATA-type domain-containing protein n=1 Tax=Turnera subulata TaxID=218843 RepID=A0A9Q0GJ92_9ROSI|nr:hypothetical protein Tsubulata_016174 [Turnera subulata]
MLYPTHHSFSFQFLSATATTTLLSPLRLSPSPPPPPPPQVQPEMECVEAALKTSIRKEMSMKASPQVLCEDLWVQNGSSCDDFFVDELLDFSNEEGLGAGEETVAEEEEVGDEKPCLVSVSSPKFGDKNSNLGAKDDLVSSVPSNELCVPADDVVSLEWLSHFVEDSNAEYCAPFPAGVVPAGPKKESPSEPVQQKQVPPAVLTEPCFKTPVPAKARSKRTRTGVRVWPLLGSPSVTESSSSSTTTSSSSSSPSSSPWLIYTNPGSNAVDPKDPVWSEERQQQQQPLLKKPKRKQPAGDAAANGGGGSQPPRRCSHCGVQKTPQWRTGPLGPKTLCNACGVRYKSGRLLPEYRPACSPSFSSELHSNHHRKVLEMRKKKEVVVVGQPEPGFSAPPVVPSFG